MGLFYAEARLSFLLVNDSCCALFHILHKALTQKYTAYHLKMSGLEVIGGIPAMIIFLDTSIKIYDSAQNDMKLPETFKSVQRRLPVNSTRAVGGECNIYASQLGLARFSKKKHPSCLVNSSSSDF